MAKISKIALQSIVDSTSEDGSTRNHLVARSGYSWSVVYDATLLLVKQERIHILRWRDAKEPIFAPGKGTNAKRPKPMTSAERTKKRREKNHGLIIARRRKRDQHYSEVGIWANLIQNGSKK